MKPRSFTQIIERRRYNTDTATLLTGDDYWDGHNYERSGRNTFLYRTSKGSYFAFHLTCWQGEADCIEPLTEGEAVQLYEQHNAHGDCRVTFEESFPKVKVEEA
jgi:hypothetical protein